MDISEKHLKMIHFAIERWIEDLQERMDDNLPEELIKIHEAELSEYEDLNSMIETLLLKQ
jgi:hypothetical protein